MGTPSLQWCRRETLGNSAALLLLAAIGVFFLRLTEGDWWLASPPAERWALAGVVLVGYLGGCTGFRRSAKNRSGRRVEAKPTEATSAEAAPNEVLAPAVNGGSHDPILVAYASQTGFAEELARQTATLLKQSGKAAHASPIHHLDHNRLARGGRVLFIASTTGDGAPPDHAVGFVRRVMQQPAAPPLESLEYAVLALGDRQYEQFCAFGHHLNAWLSGRRARPLFDVIEVDNADTAALERWQRQLQHLTSATNGNGATSATLNGFQPQPLENWRLTRRKELNPGSNGGKACLLALRPSSGMLPPWKPGDLVEIEPRNRPEAIESFLSETGHDATTLVLVDGEQVPLRDVLSRSELPPVSGVTHSSPQAIAGSLRPLKCRSYSIASLPDEGEIQLLVRRADLPNGSPGLCSGWLCDALALNGGIGLRLRTNPNFHPGDPARPLILIGNGTGIAGLRSHLKARIQASAGRNWLLFGERNADRDYFFRDDVEAWCAQGWLEHLDLAFSRDQSERIYVQHKLRDAAGRLKKWVDDGAAIYVCGSLVGMAPAVDTVLREVLGDDLVERLSTEGRYRRDVY